MTNTLELIAQAEELLKKLPAEKWFDKPQEFDDWGLIRSESGQIVAKAHGVYCTEQETITHRQNHTDPYQDYIDAIVFAHNNIPALLSSFREVIEAGNGLADIAVDPGICELPTPVERRCALAKWDALTGKSA